MSHCPVCGVETEGVFSKKKCEDCIKAKHREVMLKYNKRPEVKKRNREYRREYNKRPEVKVKRREYYSRPEVKKRRKEYQREYNKRPEVKVKQRKKIREYQYLKRQIVRRKEKILKENPEAMEALRKKIMEEVNKE